MNNGIIGIYQSVNGESLKALIAPQPADPSGEAETITREQVLQNFGYYEEKDPTRREYLESMTRRGGIFTFEENGRRYVCDLRTPDDLLSEKKNNIEYAINFLHDEWIANERQRIRAGYVEPIAVYNENDAAEILDIGRGTLKQYVRTGAIPNAKKHNGLLWFTAGALADYMKRRAENLEKRKINGGRKPKQ